MADTANLVCDPWEEFMRHKIAASVVFLGLSVVSAHASETSILYDLFPGTCKVLSIFSMHNVPVHVMAANDATGGNPGVGEVTITSLTHFNGVEMMWIGMDTQTNGIISGQGNVSGTHLMWLGPNVEIQVWDGTHIRVCNLDATNRKNRGTITIIE
jgi:hypothetical protein